MYCHFCGRNFDATEGFEELKRGQHYMTRCEACCLEQQEEEYDWRVDMMGKRTVRGARHI